MKQLVSRKLCGVENDKIWVIPNWAELETVSPSPREGNQLIKELGLSEKLIFLYAGNMGYPNDIKSFLNVAEKLTGNTNIHFIFLGAGVKKNLLEKTVSEKKLQNITILEPKPRSEQQIFLNACDVAIVSLIKKMWGVSMPSRTYNILAAGKPILALCEKGSEIELVVQEDQVGWSIAPNDPELLLDTILQIEAQKHTFEELGRRARKTALEKYSLQKAISNYAEVID
jgi:glycosyltransferase involved in cell wall biosynthesis